MPSCLISQLIMTCSGAKGNTIYWFSALQHYLMLWQEVKALELRGLGFSLCRFQLCDPRQCIGFLGSVSLSDECMIFTSAFNSAPSLCTYFVQHCVPRRTSWAGYFICESHQRFGFAFHPQTLKAGNVLKTRFGKGFKGLLIPVIIWEMAYWALWVPVRIFPHVLKGAPISQLGRNCCCERSHPDNMMWMWKHDLSQRARPWRLAQGMIGAHNGD